MISIQTKKENAGRKDEKNEVDNRFSRRLDIDVIRYSQQVMPMQYVARVYRISAQEVRYPAIDVPASKAGFDAI